MPVIRNIRDYFMDAIAKASGRGTSGHVRYNHEAKAVQAEINFEVLIEEDTIDGGYVVSCLNLPGCMSQGETPEEAIENLGDAIDGVVKARLQRRLHEAAATIAADVAKQASFGAVASQFTVPVSSTETPRKTAREVVV